MSRGVRTSDTFAGSDLMKHDSGLHLRFPHVLRSKMEAKGYFDRGVVTELTVAMWARFLDEDGADTRAGALAARRHAIITDIDAKRAELAAIDQELKSADVAADAARAKDARVQALVKQARAFIEKRADFDVARWLKVKGEADDVAVRVRAELKAVPA